MTIDTAKLEAIINEHIASQPFSGVILVHAKDETVFAKGYGFAHRADRIPNDIHTRFDIASGGKLFTGIAVCQLVEQGLITFDTLLKDCLALPFPRFDPGITVRHLLTHSSGIPDYFDEDKPDIVIAEYAALWNERPMYTMRSGKDYLPLFQDKEAKFAPGERFGYNNAGFILLGMIVEQQAGMPFGEYMAKHVFAPAGMVDSGYFALDRLPERTAYGYIEDDDGDWHTYIYSIPVVGQGDGGTFVTAPDMAKFWSALFARRLLSPAMTETYLHPHIAAESEGPDRYYGYGIWMVKEGDTVTEYFAVGGDPGATFLSVYHVPHDLHITIIGNTESPTGPLYRALEKAVLE